MPQEPKDPAPVAAKPAYTIVKQTKSRWWQVHDPDELVCLTVSPEGRARWSDALPPPDDQRLTHGSRGRNHLWLPLCLPIGLTPKLAAEVRA